MDPKEKNTYIVVDQKMIQSTTFIQVIQYLTTNIIILKNQLNTFFGLNSVLSYNLTTHILCLLMIHGLFVKYINLN